METLKQRIEECVDIEAVLKLKPLLGGACQENFSVVLMSEGMERRLALRSDATTSLPGSLSREREYAIIAAARAAGVPTPKASWLTRDLVRPGSWAYFLDWVEGVALGGKILRAPELAAARQALPAQLMQALAVLHTIESITGLEFLDQPQDPVGAALEFQREALDSLPQKRPGLELTYRWLAENRPTSRPVRLTHGDFRMGNFMVDQSGLAAVLDWEFAHFGDPLEDLAWVCVRDWRFGCVDRPGAGLCSRRELVQHYESAGGTPVDPTLLHYWEVFGNLRWAAGAQAQGLRFLEGGEPRLEFLAIARRVAEMEYEALRLIEVGPESW